MTQYIYLLTCIQLYDYTISIVVYTIQLCYFRKQHEIPLAFLVQGTTWDNFRYLEDLMGYPSWRVDVLGFRSRSRLDCLSWHFACRFMFQIAELRDAPEMLLYRPSSSSPHMLPSSSTKTCWSGCSVSMAEQKVHRKAKMERYAKHGKMETFAMSQIVGHFFHCTAPTNRN